MREIGTLADGDAARTLADYLLTLRIETRLEQQPEGWIVWVCDEDRVPEARHQFAEFQRDPADPRFGRAARAGHEIRLREIEAEEDYRQRLAEFREQMTERPPPNHQRVVTFSLLIAAVAVTLLTNFGQRDEYASYFWISSKEPQLTQIARGEVWRLVTPVFIHRDLLHLLFNCLCISVLGGQIERAQGSGRLLWLAIVFAVLSNLAEFYLGHPYDPQHGFAWLRGPHFGGLSGVGYGLFGYLWMKTRFEPELGMQLAPATAIIMMVWFFACLTGLLGAIANAAHAAGLVLGLMIGAGPYVWETLRRG
jgi:GlpG protein